MPSLLKTAILGLNRWAANEYPKRQDFVDDNDKIEAAVIAKVSNAELAELLQGARNINLVNGGELRWGMVANTFSWSKIMSIYPAGGKLLRGGVAIRSINIAVGTAVLANANDCMYITIPVTDAATAVVGVAQFSAITGTDKLIIAIRDGDSCLELLGGGWVTYNTMVEAGGKRDAYIPRSLVTAANDFLVASGSGVVVKKTLAETQAILGASIVLTGNPTAPTPAIGDSDTSIATTAFVKALGDTKLPIGGKAADSELLDGIDSNNFSKIGITSWTASSGSVTLMTRNTWMIVAPDVLGVPVAHWFIGQRIESSINDGFIELISINTSSKFRQSKVSGVWGNWVMDWNSSNDGVGTGLDADLFDGKHHTEFVSTMDSGVTQGTMYATRNGNDMSWGQSNLLLQTRDASSPALGFHRSGVSACSLHELAGSLWIRGNGATVSRQLAISEGAYNYGTSVNGTAPATDLLWFY